MKCEMKKTKKLPPHSWEPHPLTDHGEIRKPYLIVIITLAAIVALVSLLFVGKQFVGKAIGFGVPTLDQAGFFLTENTMNINESVTFPVQAYLGDKNSTTFHFELEYDPNVFEADCALIFAPLDAVFRGVDFDLTIVRESFCSAGKVSFNYSALAAEGKVITEAATIANITFTARSSAPLGETSLNFTAFEAYDLDTGGLIELAAQNATVLIVQEEFVGFPTCVDADHDSYTVNSSGTCNNTLIAGFQGWNDCDDQNETIFQIVPLGYRDSDLDTYRDPNVTQETICLDSRDISDLQEGLTTFSYGNPDNCPLVFQDNQSDSDGNGIGDACDVGALCVNNNQCAAGSCSNGTCQQCTDGDGDGYNTTGASCGPADCNDSNNLIWLNQTGYYDADNDSYGLTANSTGGLCTNSTLPVGFVASGTDCNDANPNVHPGATDIIGDGIDQDCNGADAVAPAGDGGGSSSGGGGGRRCRPSWSCTTWSFCNATLEQSRRCYDANDCQENKVEVQNCSECRESWVCGLWSGCQSGQNFRTCVDDHKCGTTILKPFLSKACEITAVAGPAPASYDEQLPPPGTAPETQQPAPVLSVWEKYKSFIIAIPSGLVLIILIALLTAHFVKPGRKMVYDLGELKEWIRKEHEMGTSNEDIKQILKQHTGWKESEIEQSFSELSSTSP